MASTLEIKMAKAFSHRLSSLLSIFCLGVTFAGLPAHSQSITPSAEDTGTLVNPEGNRIDITGGRLSQDGSNLFHSFNTFGLNTGEIANFLSTPQIHNILSRVTGGNASLINGLIQVTGGNAHLFLINPAGIVFGAEASLNVPAAFTATTANAIGLDGGWFKAVGTNDYAALVGNPSAFAFTSQQPGVLLNLGNLAVDSGKNLTLLGGTVVNTGRLSAPAGQIIVSAVPGESVVRISQAGYLLSVEVSPSPEVSGQFTVSNQQLTPSSLPQLLTGGEIGNATEMTLNSDGTVQLFGSGIAVNSGDVVIAKTQLEAQTLTLSADHNLTVVESQLNTTGNLNLVAQDTVRIRDSVTQPFAATAEGNLHIQGNLGIDILALNHLEQGTPFQSGGAMTLMSNGNISGDSHFVSVGPFQTLTLAGEPGDFISEFDPIISSNSDVLLGNYTGASLKIETLGKITAGNITITTPDITLTGTDPDIAILTSTPALILRAGVTQLRNPVSAFVVTAGGTSIQSAGYTISSLGTLAGGSYSFATDINNVGQVVGDADSSISFRAFLYKDSAITDLGTLGGSSSRATAINDAGEVVGYADDGNGGRAFLYKDGVMTDLGTLAGAYSQANDINNAGQVVGYVEDGSERAFLFSGGTVTDLGTLGGVSSHATAINDPGQVVGYVSNGVNNRAFLYNGGAVTDLGTLGGTYSQANAINNAGQVVGYADTGSGNQAFLYSSTTGMIPLGLLPGGTASVANDINNIGQVVGSANNSSGNSYAFIFNGGVITDLYDLTPTSIGWTLTSAEGINDKGQIVGYGKLGGENLAFQGNPIVTPTGGISVGNISTAGGPVILQGPMIQLTGSSITSNGGAITFDGPVNLNSTTEISADSGGGNITFNNTLNGTTPSALPAQNLTLTASTGNISLNGVVGGTTPLGNLVISSAATVNTQAITAASLTQKAGTGTTTLQGNVTTTDPAGVEITTNNITTNNITTQGGKLQLSSIAGTVNTADGTLTSAGGTVTLSANNGITTGKIDTAAANGGTVTLTTQLNDITVASINAQGGTTGTVDITSPRYFQATNSFNLEGQNYSIFTGGSLTIRHGGGPLLTPFVLGDATTNGTAAAISTGTYTLAPSLSILGSRIEGNIQILTNYTPPVVPPDSIPPVDPTNSSPPPVVSPDSLPPVDPTNSSPPPVVPPDSLPPVIPSDDHVPPKPQPPTSAPDQQLDNRISTDLQSQISPPLATPQHGGSGSLLCLEESLEQQLTYLRKLPRCQQEREYRPVSPLLNKGKVKNEH